MNNEPDDETLMIRYQNGDVQAFETLYGRYKGPLYRYLLRQCGNASVADELFQDIWMKLVRARERYEALAKFSTYLFHLAHNRLIDHYRRQARAMHNSNYDDDCPEVDEIPADRHSQPEVCEDVRQQSIRLLELIDGLPEAQREAFLLREEGGMSVEEIAEITGVSRETAKSRLRYAVAKLRSGLGGDV
ncbi:MAG: RNA polymerase sigma factor [Gammaproteobacteria bacterium]|nr:RNA polymerase sigma factor [Gammaproteobacteria bacterium]MCI0590201.1 RNA polymerase sigma factor [Gammaproteobacteria bacterium]